MSYSVALPKKTSHVLTEKETNNFELYIKSSCPSWVEPESLVDELISTQQENQYISWLDSSRKSSPYSNMSILSTHPAYMMTYSTLHHELKVNYRNGNKSVTTLKETFFDHVSNILEDCKNVSIKSMDSGSNEISDLEFQGGLVGYFAYEMKRESMEGYKTPKEQECHCSHHHNNNKAANNCCKCAEEPDAAFQFIDRFLVFDQRKRQIYICCLVNKTHGNDIGFNQMSEAMKWINGQESTILHISEVIRRKKLLDELISLTPISSTCTTPNLSVDTAITTSSVFTPDVEHEDYLNTIGKCVDTIKEGEAYEICLTTRFRLDLPKHITTQTSDPNLWNLYTRYLRKNNPAPFSALLMFPRLGLLSSSPERFLKVSNQIAEMKPIKGTVARILKCVCKENECDFGEKCEENRLAKDEVCKQQLWQDVKERAENLMVNQCWCNIHMCHLTSIL